MSEMPPLDVLTGWVQAADRRLDGVLGSLDDGTVAGPSLLPGWTRGHVLTHLARNGDGFVNLLTWARTGVETPMYASREARNADIEAGAGRGIAAQREDILGARERYRDALRAMRPEHWGRMVRMLSGPVPASAIPYMRARELWVHLVDLDSGVSPADWPEDLAVMVLAEASRSLSARVEEPFALEVTDGGEPPIVVGEAGEGATVRVQGPRCDVVAWLIGRSPGATLEVSGGALPGVPAWF